MNKLSQVMNMESARKLTENGADAFSRLDNPVLTFFAQAGAMRSRTESEVREMFRFAYQYNPHLATKMVFYIGDVRGGLGERKTFRICLNELAKINPEIVAANLDNIAFYNRYDSLYELIGTPVENAMWDYMYEQWQLDCDAMRHGRPCSLMAKWLKSVNTSSAKSVALGRATRVRLHYANESAYRKDLSKMRKYIDVVERKMSANDWKEIAYAKVPSYAMKNYRDAFMRHDPSGFGEFMSAVESGTQKIKATTLFPYDLAKVYTDNLGSYYSRNKVVEDAVVEAQWKALPNYLENEDTNIIVMADVSGSMYGRPIASSLGLAIYFAQRNHGAFHNQFMTFTNNPHFITVQEGQSLCSILKDVFDKDVGYNTNLEKAFEHLLAMARMHRVPASDMPKALVVVSDMEIDFYRRAPESIDFLAEMRRRYERCGYALPRLIFFNVEARQSTFLSMSNNALYISGQSAAAFKSVCENIESDAWSLVIKTLKDERYDRVKAPTFEIQSVGVLF